MRKLVAALSLVVGVTLLTFLLMDYFGPDLTWQFVGKNPTSEQIERVHEQLGYDRPVLLRYGDFLVDLATFDLGRSMSTGEPVAELIARTLPVTLALVLPGFVLGHALAIALALLAAWKRSGPLDRLVTTGSVVIMSVSFLVIIIVLQIALSSGQGLNWFPVRGWSMRSITAYLEHVAVPTLAIVIASIGYNTRFFRAVFVEQLDALHVRTARAFGASDVSVMWHEVLRASLVPIITRTFFSVPAIVVSGSLLLESYFGIPGIGGVTHDAIVSGDQPVLSAVVSLSALAFVGIVLLNDALYRRVDPRVMST